MVILKSICIVIVYTVVKSGGRGTALNREVALRVLTRSPGVSTGVPKNDICVCVLFVCACVCTSEKLPVEKSLFVE